MKKKKNGRQLIDALVPKAIPEVLAKANSASFFRASLVRCELVF